MGEHRSWTCPYCHETISATTQRTIKKHGETVRYRKCERCGKNFKTVERLWTESPRTQAIAALLDLNVPADRALTLVERATPRVVLRYVAALPAFQCDRARRNDPIRSPGGFICWAIEACEPIPDLEQIRQTEQIEQTRQTEQIEQTRQTEQIEQTRQIEQIEQTRQIDDDLWSRAMTELQQQMTRSTFDRWLRGTRQIERSNGSLTIGVPDQYTLEWCKCRLLPVIERTVTDVAGKPIEIRFQVCKA